jgi:hypothetical protein
MAPPKATSRQKNNKDLNANLSPAVEGKEAVATKMTAQIPGSSRIIPKITIKMVNKGFRRMTGPVDER